MKQTKETSDGAGSIQIAHYLVLLLDVLGQRDKLQRLTSLPTSKVEFEQTRAILSETVGNVKIVREAFETYFKTQTYESALALTLPASERERLRQLSKADVRTFVFSDSIVISVPLHNSNDHCTPMNGVFVSLFAACSAMTVGLAAGIPLRGGVDVGIGVEMTESEIYGSAFVRAYDLESKKAGYLRIVVGEQLVHYIETVEGQLPATDSAKCAIALASKCRSAIFKDSDGLLALDFFGRTFAVESKLDASFLPKAIEFAEAEKSKWCGLGNATLDGRYDLLLAYLRDRQEKEGGTQ